jgi:hypothetical protein
VSSCGNRTQPILQAYSPFFPTSSSLWNACLSPTHETRAQVSWVHQTLLRDKKIARASHNVVSYRFHDAARGIDCHDNDDDGETGAGSRLAEVMHLIKAQDVFVMVRRARACMRE